MEQTVEVQRVEVIWVEVQRVEMQRAQMRRAQLVTEKQTAPAIVRRALLAPVCMGLKCKCSETVDQNQMLTVTNAQQ